MLSTYESKVIDALHDYTSATVMTRERSKGHSSRRWRNVDEVLLVHPAHCQVDGFCELFLHSCSRVVMIRALNHVVRLVWDVARVEERAHV